MGLWSRTTGRSSRTEEFSEASGESWTEGRAHAGSLAEHAPQPPGSWFDVEIVGVTFRARSRTADIARLAVWEYLVTAPANQGDDAVTPAEFFGLDLKEVYGQTEDEMPVAATDPVAARWHELYGSADIAYIGQVVETTPQDGEDLLEWLRNRNAPT